MELTNENRMEVEAQRKDRKKEEGKRKKLLRTEETPGAGDGEGT